MIKPDDTRREEELLDSFRRLCEKNGRREWEYYQYQTAGCEMSDLSKIISTSLHQEIMALAQTRWPEFDESKSQIVPVPPNVTRVLFLHSRSDPVPLWEIDYLIMPFSNGETAPHFKPFEVELERVGQRRMGFAIYPDGEKQVLVFSRE